MTSSLIQNMLKYLFILTLIIFQFSCSEFLKGKSKKNDVIEVKKENLTCVKEIPQQWKLFTESKTTEKDIDQVFTCLDSTLTEFQTRVEGRVEAESFTRDELFQIFDKFLNDSKISRAATNDLLVLKSAILGGTIDKITRKEIGDLKNYLLKLKIEAKAILPYTPILKFKKSDVVYSKRMLNDGFAQLNLSLKNLFKTSQLYRADYQFSDLQRLVTNLNIIDQEQTDLLKLAQKVKVLLVGNQSIQTENDYLLFIDNLTEVLKLYSFQVQGYVKFEIDNADQMVDALDFIQSWFDLFENSLQFKRSSMLAAETIDPVLTEIHSRGLIPVSLSLDTLLQFYKTLSMRAFDSGLNADVLSFTGFTKAHFNKIRRELAVFKINLLAINDISRPEVIKAIAGKDRLSLAEVQKKLKVYKISELYDFKKLDDVTQKSVQKSFEDFKAEFLSERPVIYRFKKMIVAVNQEIWDQNWQDLARGLYNKMLARELLIGWGTPNAAQDMTTSWVSEAGLVQWYADFKKFGVETKAFDPRMENSGSVSFKQANLLTYSADGDDKMNYFESVQYLNLVLSGGGQTLDEIFKGSERANCQLNQLDKFNNKWNDEKCLMKDLRQNFKYYFSNLSYLVKFVDNLSPIEFEDFYYSVMDVTRFDPKLKGQSIETADLRTFSILLHYIEALYAKYDVNRNWTFSAAEIRGAYPRFKLFAKDYAYSNAKSSIDEFNGFLAQTIGGYGCYSEDDLIKESFVFLVFHGRAPTQSDLNTTPCLFGNSLIDFSGEVNRKNIINTFKILKSVIGS